MPLALLATFGPQHGEQPPLLLALVATAALLVTFGALALLPTDPRLAIAGAVPLTPLGVSVVFVPFMLAAPLVVSLAIVRTRGVRSNA